MPGEANIPRISITTQKIISPVSKCGDNWWKTIKIRAPYRHIDIAFRKLPLLGDVDQVEYFDSDILEEIAGDRERIAKFAERNSDIFTENQIANIQNMLDRAARYVIDAVKIQTGWASGFETHSGGQVPAWPLGSVVDREFSASILEGHGRDERTWKKLVQASLRNLRCAEEVAKRATIRHRNKEIWEYNKGRRFGINGLATEDGDDEKDKITRLAWRPQEEVIPKGVKIHRISIASGDSPKGPECKLTLLKDIDEYLEVFGGGIPRDLMHAFNIGNDMAFYRFSSDPAKTCELLIDDGLYPHVTGPSEKGPFGSMPVKNVSEWRQMYGGGASESAIMKLFRDGATAVVFTRPEVGRITTLREALPRKEAEELEEGDIDLTEPEVPSIPVPEPAKGYVKPKKKDNTAILFAAAGIGAIVLMKR